MFRHKALLSLTPTWKEPGEYKDWLKKFVRSPMNKAMILFSMLTVTDKWKEDPEILSVLKYLAQSDEDEVVRQFALNVLSHR